MAKFDPDKYIEKHSNGFDPDAYLAKHAPDITPAATHQQQELPIEAPSQLESAVFGLAKSGTLNFAPKIAGVANVAGDYLSSLFTGEASKPVAEQYEQSKQQYLQQQAQAKEANPLSFMGGELAGTTGQLLIPGGQVRTIVGGVRELPALGKILSSIPGLTAMGAASAVGENEGDLQSKALDALKGGAVGAATGTVLNKLVPLLTGSAKEAYQLGQKGYATIGDTGRKKAGEAIDEILTKGTDQNILPFLKSLQSNASRDLTKAEASELNKVIEKFASSNEIKDPKQVLSEVRAIIRNNPTMSKEVIQDLVERATSSNVISPKNLRGLKEDFGALQGSPTASSSVKTAANDLKEAIAKKIEEMAPGYEEAAKDYATLMNNRLTPELGISDLRSLYKIGKKLIGDIAPNVTGLGINELANFIGKGGKFIEKVVPGLDTSYLPQTVKEGINVAFPAIVKSLPIRTTQNITNQMNKPNTSENISNSINSKELTPSKSYPPSGSIDNPEKLSKSLSDYSTDELQTLVDKLKNSGNNVAARNIDKITNAKNEVQKNAATFNALQQPNIRKNLYDSDEEGTA